jgi:hypothetical protein
MMKYLRPILILLAIGAAICSFYHFKSGDSSKMAFKLAPVKKDVALKKIELKPIVSEKVAKSEKTLAKKSHHPIPSIEKIVIQYFPDIIFETLDDCPRKLTHSKYWSEKNSDIDSYCSNTKELESGIEFQTRQKYLNGRLVEYNQSVMASEPVSIKFESLEQLSEVFLWIDGAVVFGIKFKSNLVSSYFFYNEEVEQFYRKYNDSENERKGMQPRIKILKEGKRLIETLLYDLCKRSKHKKTCDTHQDLVDFRYMP